MIFVFGYCGQTDVGKERVDEYFANYGKTTFTVHKPYSVDTFTWEGSFNVRDGSIYTRVLNQDSTNCSLHLSVDLKYPITYIVQK